MLPLHGDQSGIQNSLSLINTLCSLKNMWSNFIPCLTYKHIVILSYNVHYYLGHKDTIKIHRYCRYTWHPGLANKTKQITLKFMDESHRDNALLLPYFPENGTDCEFKNVIWK